MELSIDQQIFEQFKKSNKILIFLPENLDADALAGGLALRLFLQKQQKDASLASSGHAPEVLKFLPGASELRPDVSAGKSLVASLDISVKKLEEISYQTSADKVHIYLKSKSHEFTPQDISFSSEKFPLDLIVTLGAKSLEALGKIYEQHAGLFFETPKINIDNKTDNEYFGQLNLVDVTATSVSEILAGFMQKHEQQLLDEDIATCLLAGIIAKTHSFQHVQTTPRAFLKAGELVSLGGRQQEVVKNIFKTKSLPLLKLWGRALARMRTLGAGNAVYSVLNHIDFEKSESGEAEVLSVLEELLDNVSGYKIAALITESAKGEAELTAAVHEQIHAELFLQSLNMPGKVLNSNLGNYKLLQASSKELSPEALEQKFLEAIKGL